MFDLKFICQQINKQLSKESHITISYDIADDDSNVEFTFHGSMFGMPMILFEKDLIVKTGIEPIKNHLRQLRNGIIAAESRTSRQLIHSQWRDEGR